MTRRVVVTGIGVLSPVGSDEEFWPALVAGRSGIRPITGFDATGHPVRIAGEVRDVRLADWMDVKDLARLDRVCHFALAAAGMAVRDAALDGLDPDRVGVVFGTAIGGAETMRQGVIAEHDKGPRYVSPLFVVTGIPNMATALVSVRFGFRGPSFTPVTACSSGADAIGWGARLVRDGYADACLVGGSEAAVCPPILASFAQLRALSRRNADAPAASRPFDADRDGFVIAEGAAALVLESEEGARRRGARIHAEVAGYGQSSDAFHETAPDPSGAGAARAIRAALADAGTEPARVGYVNAHGTGTRLSDAAETAALKQAFGAGAYRLAVSSTKSMTGHLLGAAGAVEAAATALALRDGVLPPTVNLTRADPDCDLDFIPGAAREVRAGTAISLSMGFGGHNSCLVLREVADGADRHGDGRDR